MFDNVSNIKNNVKMTRSLIMLVECYMIYLTKYIYFILMMLVKCTKMYLLHGKFDNVGNIKNKVKMTRSLIMLVECYMIYLTKYIYFILLMLVNRKFNVGNIKNKINLTKSFIILVEFYLIYLTKYIS